MVGVSVEYKIRKISRRADELRKLLELSEEMTQVTLELFSNNKWHITVRPSLLTFGDQTHMFTRGYHGKNLMETLDNALDGTTDELALYKKGLTRGFKI